MAYNLWAEWAAPAGFVGRYEICTYTFSTPFEQLPFEQQMAAQVINQHIAKLAEQDSQLLRIKVWRDTSPMFVTKYWVAVAATASPLWWNLIILGVLAIFILVFSKQLLSVAEGIIEDVGDIIEDFPEGLGGAIGMGMVLGFGLLTLGTIVGGYMLLKKPEGGHNG